MVKLSCPEVISPIKYASHMLFFRFFETEMATNYALSKKFVISAGSYPLYYYVKGRARSSQDKAKFHNVHKNFYPNDFDLWTNLENIGQVVEVLVQFLNRNQDLKAIGIQITGGKNKYRRSMSVPQICGIISFRLVTKRSNEASIPIQVICWDDEHDHHISCKKDLLLSVVEHFDISICKVGWLSGANLEEIMIYDKQVMLDIKEKQFTIKFKRFENMEAVQKRLTKYIQRGFALREIIFPLGLSLQDVNHRFVANVRNVSDNEMDEA